MGEVCGSRRGGVAMLIVALGLCLAYQAYMACEIGLLLIIDVWHRSHKVGQVSSSNRRGSTTHRNQDVTALKFLE